MDKKDGEKVIHDHLENAPPNYVRILLLGSGCLFLLAALLYNEVFAQLLVPHSPLHPITLKAIRSVQIHFLALALFFLISGQLTVRIRRIKSFVQKPWVTNITLAVLVCLVPMFFLEMIFRPVATAGRSFTFMEDDELIWKLRPNSEDVYGDVRYEVNAKGLRGPELDYAKPANVKRILYLGDSVTIGYRLAHYAQAFPHQIESLLEDRTHLEIETINAAVDGYSTWQEYGYLRREGINYQPDLVVVGFVLNDVLEPFKLRRFGGHGEGFLLKVYSAKFDRLAYKSGIMYLVRKIGAVLRFGPDLRRQAGLMERTRIDQFIARPDRPEFQRAWDKTFEDLDSLFGFCRGKNVPGLLVVFPTAQQLADPQGTSAMQKKLMQFAAERAIPALDLLPALSARQQEENPPSSGLFMDETHPTVYGHRVIAEIIAEYMQEQGFLN